MLCEMDHAAREAMASIVSTKPEIYLVRPLLVNLDGGFVEKQIAVLHRELQSLEALLGAKNRHFEVERRTRDLRNGIGEVSFEVYKVLHRVGF